MRINAIVRVIGWVGILIFDVQEEGLGVAEPALIASPRESSEAAGSPAKLFCFETDQRGLSVVTLSMEVTNGPTVTGCSEDQ